MPDGGILSFRSGVGDRGDSCTANVVIQKSRADALLFCVNKGIIVKHRDK